MDGKPSSAGIVMPMPEVQFGFLDLQGSVQTHQQDNLQLYPRFSMVDSQTQNVFPFGVRHVQDCQKASHFLDGDGGGGGGQCLVYKDDEMSREGEIVDGLDGFGQEKESPWQRIKWEEKMVKLLITAVSYVGEDLPPDCVGHRKMKGKWKCVSRAMVSRGYLVSPQQCEDKFNDLNKRYKKLNRVLGRGTACKVVENPKLLRSISMAQKLKESVGKILSSKHLFYEQMCSYHNGNRLFLPHDPELQCSLKLDIARNTYDSEPLDPERLNTFSSDIHDQDAKVKGRGGKGVEHLGMSPFPEMLNQAYESEVVGPGNSLENSHCNRNDAQKQMLLTDLNQVFPGRDKGRESQWLVFRLLELKEQKMHLGAQIIEIKKLQCKWQMINWKRDRELDNLRLENQRMKLENEYIASQIKHKKMGAT